MPQARVRSFEEFWPCYVRAHARKKSRMLHFAGTSAAMACVAGAILLRRPRLAALAPILGYGAAWIGHFFIEKNKPATFGHPLWSLRADLQMWSKIAAGTMDAEVERIMAESAESAESEDAVDEGGLGRVKLAGSGAPPKGYAVS